jgi:hypothetical protein
MGMKAGSNSSGFVVYDTAYYVGLLRKKIKDVDDETNKLTTEVDQSSKDNTKYAQLERKYEKFSKDKETLEGQLADYNLALDKVSSVCFVVRSRHKLPYVCVCNLLSRLRLLALYSFVSRCVEQLELRYFALALFFVCASVAFC